MIKIVNIVQCKLKQNLQELKLTYKTFLEKGWLFLLFLHLTAQFDLLLNLERMNGGS